MKAGSESGIVTACLQLLAVRKVFAWRCNNTGIWDAAKGIYRKFGGLPGVSDILGVLDDGRFLAVEVKTSTGKLRDDQRTFLDAVQKRGGLALVVRSVADLDRALTFEGVGT